MVQNFNPKVNTFSLFLPQTLAANSTRMSTLLAPTGVKVSKLVEDYNQKVSQLPKFFKIGVILTIYPNKNYDFSFFLPTIGYIISITKSLYTHIYVHNKQKITEKFFVISWKTLVKICLLKFNKCDKRDFYMVYSTAKSMNLRII